MTIHTITTLAGMLARQTGQAFTLIYVYDETHQWGIPELFTALDDTELEGENHIAISHAGPAEAQDAFNRLTQEAIEAYRRAATPGLEIIVGYVGGGTGIGANWPVITTSNVIAANTRQDHHVFKDGTVVTDKKEKTS